MNTWAQSPSGSVPALGDLDSDEGRELSLSGLFAFLEVYRLRDGFCREEVLEIEEAFARYDHDHEGRISTLEVGKVLRWLGYQTSWELQQMLVADVDIDRSGSLDKNELQKLVRRYRERDMETIVQTFNEFDLNGIG